MSSYCNTPITSAVRMVWVPERIHVFCRRDSGNRSRLGTHHPDLECSRGQVSTLRMNRHIHAQSRQSASNDATWKPQKLCTVSYAVPYICLTRELERKKTTHSLRLLHSNIHTPRPQFSIRRNAMQRLKATVRQHKCATVIRLQIINLFPEQPRPQILAHKLDTVQLRRRPRLIR